MATSVSEYVEYEEKDGVGIWKIEDFPAAIEAEDMKAAEQHYVETASDPEMRSVVVTVGGVENMDSEVLEHVEKKVDSRSRRVGCRLHCLRCWRDCTPFN